MPSPLLLRLNLNRAAHAPTLPPQAPVTATPFQPTPARAAELAHVGDMLRPHVKARKAAIDVRKQLRVRAAAPGSGITHVSIKGDSSLLARLGMAGINTEHGDKHLEYLAVPADGFDLHVAGGEKKYRPEHMEDGELKATLARRSESGEAPATPAEHTAYINGSFYNVNNSASRELPMGEWGQYKEASSIGDSHVVGKTLPKPLGVPQPHQDVSARVDGADGSYLTSSPLLAGRTATGGQESRFTTDMAAEDKYRFKQNQPIKPGYLDHAEHPNPRSFIVEPGQGGAADASPARDYKSDQVRMVAAIDESGRRGPTSGGLTMVETATVAARLGSMNRNPGQAVNLDGGASTRIGLLDREGRHRMVFEGVPGSISTMANFLVMEPKPREADLD